MAMVSEQDLNAMARRIGAVRGVDSLNRDQRLKAMELCILERQMLALEQINNLPFPWTC